jgi:hypothetical protein
VGEAPLREWRWALLALAQYQAGHQGEALRTLHRARTVLASELGLDPGPDLVALETAILRQDPSLVAAVALPEPSVTCPYLGLVPYDVGDADGFFGRDTDVAACLRRLTAVGALAVVGPSGSGKSSLVRAGVAAALERGGRRVVVVTPGARPCDALTALPAGGPAPVLMIDQCEEAVTLCQDTSEQAQFFAALAAHAERGSLVVALRADRLGDLSAHPGFARLIEPGLYLLGAMGETDLRAAIEGPARQAALLLEPGLVELLVQEVEGEPGALPLLSHAMRQTWRGARPAHSPWPAIAAPAASAARWLNRPRGSTTSCRPTSARSYATCCCGWWRPAPRVIRCAAECPAASWPSTPPTSSWSSSSWPPGSSPAMTAWSNWPTRRWPGPCPGCRAGSMTTSRANASCGI